MQNSYDNEKLLRRAQTGPGKTSLALYATATPTHANRQVVCTSQVKTLSNQKFAEVKTYFDSAGILSR